MNGYIKDNDGTVRACTSNVARMNIFEYMYLFRHILKDNIISMTKEFLECWSILMNMLLILILPVYYPIMAYQHIKRAKKEMKKYNKN